VRFEHSCPIHDLLCLLLIKEEDAKLLLKSMNQFLNSILPLKALSLRRRGLGEVVIEAMNLDLPTKPI